MSAPDASAMLGDPTLLRRIEVARKENDLQALEQCLKEAKDQPGTNKAFIDQALEEVSTAKKLYENQDGIAKELKDRGNAKLKVGTKSSLKEAGEIYSQALTILLEGKDVKQAGDDVSKIPGQTRMLLSQLFNNRAQATLQLQEYTACVDDCKRSIKYDATTVKAFYRAARASMLNGLYQQAIDFCTRGLQIDSESTDLKKIYQQCADKHAEKVKKRQKLDISPQELLEQKERLESDYRQIQSLKSQLVYKQQKKRVLQITGAFVKDLERTDAEFESESQTYRSCGRAFLWRKKQTIVSDTEKQATDIDTELVKIQDALKEFEKRTEARQQEYAEAFRFVSMREKRN